MSILRRRRETHAVFETGRIPLLLHLVWLEEGKKVKCWASYRFHPQHFNVCLRGWFKSVAECETHSISVPPNMCTQYCRLGYGNGAVNTGVENVIALPYNLSPKNPALPLFRPQLFCGACSKHLICLSLCPFTSMQKWERNGTCYLQELFVCPFTKMHYKKKIKKRNKKM